MLLFYEMSSSIQNIPIVSDSSELLLQRFFQALAQTRTLIRKHFYFSTFLKTEILMREEQPFPTLFIQPNDRFAKSE